MFVRKYHFSEELLRELQLVYAGKNKTALTDGLDRLVRKSGWPRYAFTAEARRRGWTTEKRSCWTEEEVDFLRERLGTISIRKIAKKLGRSHEATRAKAERLHLSRRVREGYSMTDLQAVFGVHQRRVRWWVERGLLGRPRRNGNEVRLDETSVVRFMRRHTDEYDLRRVDQAWFKAMVFGAMAGYGERV